MTTNNQILNKLSMIRSNNLHVAFLIYYLMILLYCCYGLYVYGSNAIVINDSGAISFDLDMLPGTFIAFSFVSFILYVVYKYICLKCK